MRPARWFLLVLALAACDRGADVPPAVLTLFPPAFRGGSASDEALCLAPGQEVAANVWVHHPEVIFTVRGRSGGEGEVEASLGGAGGRAPTGAADAPFEATFRVRPPAGVQALRLSHLPGAQGEFCLHQVAVAQP